MLNILLTTTIAQVQRRTEQVSISPIAKDPGVILNSAYTTFLTVVGIAAVFAIVVGGFQMITSQGDPGAVTKGKKTITAAIIGLLIVIIAEIVLRTTADCAVSLFTCRP